VRKQYRGGEGKAHPTGRRERKKGKRLLLLFVERIKKKERKMAHIAATRRGKKARFAWGGGVFGGGGGFLLGGCMEGGGAGDFGGKLTALPYLHEPSSSMAAKGRAPSASPKEKEIEGKGSSPQGEGIRRGPQTIATPPRGRALTPFFEGEGRERDFAGDGGKGCSQR